MLNALIVLSILALFVLFEFILRLASLIAPAAFGAFAERLQAESLRRIFRILRHYRGFEVELESRLDEALPQRFIIVANHQSLIDIPVLMYVLPERSLRFVAKRELGTGVPFVSYLLRVQGHGLIRRHGDLLRTMKEISRFARRCRRDATSPVIFPEGTRSRTGQLGVFHTAGFRRIQEVEALPILVAAIDGGSRVAKVGDIVRNLGRYPYHVRLVTLLPPPADKHGAVAALEESRSLIETALLEMRESS